jgi:2-dehydro-3-deoxyphosphogluconate aldolase/(4S)-4-hydroxy-2-oxoglutarate aldolase
MARRPAYSSSSARIKRGMTVTRRLVGRRETLAVFSEDRLAAVIRTPTPELAERAARAMAEAGVRLIEITLTVPDALALIRSLALDPALIDRGAIVGAGTVLSGAQAEDALLAGARFLVSPALVPEMIAVGRARDALTMPGTLTPTEMLRAAQLGADLIKVYPVAPVGGPDYIINVRRALPDLPLVATGNVELAEIPRYLAAGAVGFGIGSPLVRPDFLEAGDTAAVVTNAQRFLAASRR